MERKIKIKAGQVGVAAELSSSRTAEAIWEALPLRGQVSLWGEEIYFSIPLKLELEDGREVVSIGDLGYWPQGRAFCIFFGLTPVSEIGRIRPASAVSIFGKVVDDTSVLRRVSAGEEVVVEKDNSAR
jgi:hypothetical protein